MIIVRVKFYHWNDFKKTVDVTSDMCESLKHCKNDIELFTLAIKYIERRYIECMNIDSVEVIAR